MKNILIFFSPLFFREFALQKKDWMTQKVFFRVLQQVLDFNTFLDSSFEIGLNMFWKEMFLESY